MITPWYDHIKDPEAVAFDPNIGVVGVLLVACHIPAPQSLKEKRMVLKSVKKRTANRFPVSVSELDGQDTWQTATLGFAMLGQHRSDVEPILHQVLAFVTRCGDLNVCSHHIRFH